MITIKVKDYDNSLDTETFDSGKDNEENRRDAIEWANVYGLDILEIKEITRVINISSQPQITQKD